MICALGSFGNAKIPKRAITQGKILWLDASDPNNTGVQPANNTTITSWKNKIGGGGDGTASGNITLNTTGLGGLYPALSFSSTFYTGSVSNSNPTLTIFVVCSITSTSHASARIVSLGTPSTAGTDRNSSMVFARLNASGLSGYRNAVYEATNNAGSLGVPYLFETWYDGTTNYNIVHKGETTLPTSIACNRGDFGITSYAIGRDTLTTDAANFNGFISEVIVYNTALSTADREYMEGYLSWKWGLQAKLKSDHPYYNTAPNGEFVFKIKGDTSVPTTTTAGSGYAKTYAITNTGGVTITATVGTRTNAITLSGANYLQITYSAPVIFTRTFWLSTSTPQTNSGNVFSGSKFYTFFNQGTTLKSQANSWDLVNSTVVQTTTWLFYAIIQTATTNSIYVDGVFKASTTNTGWVGDTGNIRFGALYTGANNYTGHMDDMRLYARELSVAEIQAIYAAG